VAQHRFRFLTYNIRKGKGASGRLDGSVGQMAAALQGQHPDVMFCQEVYHGGRTQVFQSTELAAELGMTPYYEPNRTRKTAHYGNATFSRFPACCVVNHNISTNPIEKRGVLYAKLEVDSKPVHVFNAHLGLNQRQRSTQIKHIAQLIGEVAQPGEAVLLAGDFNDWNRRLDRYVTRMMGLTNTFAHVQGRDSFTWHARRPVFNLDRVYVRNLQAVHCGRLSGAPWNTLSDHFPLWVELEIL
jgi:endonuclease/exonuclease/phosphatase family metal-dependent hydrolase